ncbi:MAG: UDP-N-acetylmuramate--L-alanine ligase [Pseudomonadota bacterium]|nr:UDP-N-acetylmuramate--L-alanine ligase [Pseudomonadota bacterium]
MSALPLDIGTIHFIGVGGIGMSGIAEILQNLGYTVQGSDIADSSNVKRLRNLGIQVEIGHRRSNIGTSAVVVISSAIKADNPEVQEARSRLIPVVPRAEMLAEIMRLKWGIAVAGTHGKTTTTSIIAALLDAGEFDPTVINGGIINAYGTNARLGSGKWVVAEADESDGTFTRLPATIAVVTNIDAEHLDHYGNFDALKAAFVTFVQNIPFYGFATMCIDDTVLQSLIAEMSDRRIVTYGLCSQANVRAVNIASTPLGSEFTVTLSNRASPSRVELGRFTMPMPGNHNIRNALAAIAIAQEMGVPTNTLQRALSEFRGVKRRFTKIGVVNDITIIDDYGHHPVEISAALEAARTNADGNVIAVIQPHRYTRVRDLFDAFCNCFHDADTVIVADIYAAGEIPLDGVDQNALIRGIRERGHCHVITLRKPKDLPQIIADIGRPGDFIIFMGAGTITNWANSLPAGLRELGRNTVIVSSGGAN